MVDTAKFLRLNYRDDIIEIAIDKTIERGKATNQSVLRFDPLKYIQSMRYQFSGVVRWVVDFILAKFPLLKRIPELLQDVDLDNPDRTIIKQQILFRLQRFVDREKEPRFWSWIVILVAINCILLIVLYVYMTM